jgi:hypothetical protein
MRAAARILVGLALAVPGLLVSQSATAQQANAAHTHLANVADRFAETPGSRGLIATAIAEVTVAVQHAQMGAEALDNLGTMKLHAGHVINCVDPTIEADGPCLGYGIKKANDTAIREMEAAAAVPGSSASVRILSAHILTAIRNSNAIADVVVATAKRLQAATDVTAAGEIAQLLAVMTEQMQTGWDKNEDGTISLAESGLNQANQRATLLKRAEGIGAVGAP